MRRIGIPPAPWRWLRRRYTAVAVAVSAFAALLAVVATGPASPIDGLVFDHAAALAWRVKGRPVEPSAQVAVVGIDWRSLEDERLAALPRALFAPIWAELVTALGQAGARVIAFDLIFQYQGSAFIANYDSPFLQALAAHRGRVVLARTGGTVPARPYQFAAGSRPPAIALAEMVPDEGVVRRVASAFPLEDGSSYPTLSGAALMLSGRELAGGPTRFLPAAPLELAVPTYSLSDILRLAGEEAGRRQLQRAFAGRVVLVGTLLPEEDRKIAPDRFMLDRAGEPRQQADLPPRLGISAADTGSVPGVMLHAVAIDALLANKALADLPLSGFLAVVAACAAVGALAGCRLAPAAATALVGVVAAPGVAAATWAAAERGWYVPAGYPLLALGGALVVAYATRYLVEERRRLHLRRAFGHYVAPAVVASLEAAEEVPQLGGETREITCMFADLSGFTALSSQVDPPTLMAVTNRYLGLIAAEVDRSGGYVDKFIGDAVMAMWNAPSPLAEHPLRAVEAARAAAAAVAAEAAQGRARGWPVFSVKIGVNTGRAVVGNLGADNRFNYTAVGEAVNISARLEPLPALYGCALIFAEATAERLGDRVAVCELDLVLVKGKDEPVRIFTALPGDPAAQQGFLAGWGQALAAYRAGEFAAAAQAWRAVPPPAGWAEDAFGPALVLAERAEALAAAPPERWKGVWKVGKG